MESSDDLNKLYDPLQFSVRGDSPDVCVKKFLDLANEECQRALEDIPGTLDISYGDTEGQKMDIFGEDILSLNKDAPVFVYIHGGYWVFGSRQDARLFVPTVFESGAMCCVVGYDLVSESVLLPDVVGQIRKAIKFILSNTSRKGSRDVFLCGQSAGAHLLAMALSSFPGKIEQAHLIKGVILISGLYDLRKMWTTCHAEAARISENIATDCSPQIAINKLKNNLGPSTQVHILVGEFDSPAFREQSDGYYKELQRAGVPSTYFLIEGEDHMTLAENLTSSESTLMKKIFEIMKAKKGKYMSRM